LTVLVGKHPADTSDHTTSRAPGRRAAQDGRCCTPIFLNTRTGHEYARPRPRAEPHTTLIPWCSKLSVTDIERLAVFLLPLHNFPHHSRTSPSHSPHTSKSTL
jgi:hypothetical protein